MKRRENVNSNVLTSGLERTSYTIKASGKAFQILSSSLYTDKPLAIVRELSCNAYDAHVEAGKKDTPFHIHLPTKFEPHLEVVDYGTGLSDKDIRGELVPVLDEDSNEVLNEDGEVVTRREGGLYTTYFDSTKDQRNDEIGAMGLGSKTPLSYQRSFTVISRFNGIKYQYSVFISEQGVPDIVLLAETKTDEVNGMTIKMAIKEEDIRTFRTATKRALRHFDLLPTTNIDNFEFEQVEYSWACKTYGIAKNGYDTRRVEAVMGNIGYPISHKALGELTEKQQSILTSQEDLHLFFEIGEVDVAASREELSYDPQTIEAIKARVDEVIGDIDTEIKKIKSTIKSEWGAALVWSVLNRGLYGGASDAHISEFLCQTHKLWRKFGARSDLFVGQIVWNGKIIRDCNLAVPNDTPWTYRTKVYWRDEIVDNRVTNTLSGLGADDYDRRKGLPQYNLSISAGPKTLVLVQDMRTKATKLCRHLTSDKDSRWNRVVLIKIGTPNPTAEDLKKSAKEAKTLLEKEISGCPVQYMSDVIQTIPKDALESEKKTKEKKRKVPQILIPTSSNRHNPGKYHKDSWDHLPDDEQKETFDEGGVYVKVNGFDPFYRDPNNPGDKIEDVEKLGSFLELFKKDLNLVGVRQKGLPDFEANDNWQTVEEFIRDKVDKNELENLRDALLLLAPGRVWTGYDTILKKVTSITNKTPDQRMVVRTVRESIDACVNMLKHESQLRDIFLSFQKCIEDANKIFPGGLDHIHLSAGHGRAMLHAGACAVHSISGKKYPDYGRRELEVEIYENDRYPLVRGIRHSGMMYDVLDYVNLINEREGAKYVK